MGAPIEYVDVPGASLWTAWQGAGPGLVLCHGGPGMWDYLAPVADMVDDLATTYRYDQRACGRSRGKPAYDLTTAAADLEALRAHWGLSRWVVAGHSWGATLALAYCLRHPARAAGLLYLSGAGIDPAWHAEYRANRAALLGPEGQRRLADLAERLPLARGAEFAAVSRALCELVSATDIADQARAPELVGALFVDDLHPNAAYRSAPFCARIAFPARRVRGGQPGRWGAGRGAAARRQPGADRRGRAAGRSPAGVAGAPGRSARARLPRRAEAAG